MAVAIPSIAQLSRDAQAAFALADYGRAEELFRVLCREEPYKPAWRLELATVLIAKIEFDAAELALREATSLASGNSAVTRLIALAWFRMLKYDIAKRLLEPAAAEGNEESLLGLLQVLERQGSYDEAAEWVKRALQGRSPNPEFHYIEALVLSRQNKNDEAEPRLRLLIDSPSNAPLDVRYKASYLLAGILDRSQRFAEAVAVLDAAKREFATQPQIKNLRKQHRAHVAAWRELTTKVNLAEISRWRDDMADIELGFRPSLLTGHPRSGTTLLEAQLEKCQNVVALEETNAFSGGAMAAAGFNRDDFFHALFPRSTERVKDARCRYARAVTTLHGGPLAEGNLVIDKNPSLLTHLPLFLRLMPEVRLLIALRDPRDVVISSYFLYLPANATSVQFLDWEATCRHYAEFSDLWLKTRPNLPSDCWQECRYEDMVADADSETARIAAFLQVDCKKVASDESVSNLQSSAPSTVTIHSPNYATAGQPVHSRSVTRWHNYAEQLKSGTKFLEPFIHEFRYQAT